VVPGRAVAFSTVTCSRPASAESLLQERATTDKDETRAVGGHFPYGSEPPKTVDQDLGVLRVLPGVLILQR
jgi:hypothetical protein